MSGVAKLAMAYCPFGSTEEAARISRQLVEEKHVACANILGETQSVYRWQGEIAQEIETAVLFKLRVDAVHGFMDQLTALHSYDEPAILCWNIDAAPDGFVRWMDGQVRK
ncbi:divalent-cation tolerance protein CutA [Sphingorhabdus sp. Alg239-R122]|uniref:divalent-cation tolerance protein CutA n=1 Tax=Sphingorhabdus sp. Alg239-R122 TaxID=2305989 RepID=UPI001F07C20A|nr:divalent-cation tolerance protein CutA [Sphingorhabdus sp. Alg239-R122]